MTNINYITRNIWGFLSLSRKVLLHNSSLHGAWIYSIFRATVHCRRWDSQSTGASFNNCASTFEHLNFAYAYFCTQDQNWPKCSFRTSTCLAYQHDRWVYSQTNWFINYRHTNSNSNARHIIMDNNEFEIITNYC